MGGCCRPRSRGRRWRGPSSAIGLHIGPPPSPRGDRWRRRGERSTRRGALRWTKRGDCRDSSRARACCRWWSASGFQAIRALDDRSWCAATGEPGFAGCRVADVALHRPPLGDRPARSARRPWRLVRSERGVACVAVHTMAGGVRGDLRHGAGAPQPHDRGTALRPRRTGLRRTRFARSSTAIRPQLTAFSWVVQLEALLPCCKEPT